MVKRPLKIRLSMSSQNSDSGVSCLPLAEDNPGMEAVNSPSTRDAVAGMLSISQGEKLPPKLAVKASLKLKKSAASRMKRTADMKMNKVHQDDDYIYPALEASDDEEIPLQKDDAWNPKIRMSGVSAKV